MTDLQRQSIIQQSINSSIMDNKNMTKIIDSYIKYNIYHRFNYPDMLAILSITEKEYPEYEYRGCNDDEYKVYYFWFNNNIHLARRIYERVELLYNKVTNDIGYIQDDTKEWYNGYKCHTNKDKYIFIETSFHLYSNIDENEKQNYIPIVAFEIQDTYTSFNEFKSSLLKRFHTISKIIKTKGPGFYDELSVYFNDEILFDLIDFNGDPTIEDFDHYKDEVEEWTSLLYQNIDN